MIDGFRKGFVEPGFFAVSKLRDARNSYVEILKLKLAVKNHLLEEWLTGRTFPGKTREDLRSAFSSFTHVRSKYSPYKEETQADTAWILGAKDSVLAAELLEQLVYLDTFDGRYRDALKSKHECADVLGYPSIKKNRGYRGSLEKGSGDAPSSSTGTGSAASAAEEAKLTKDEQQQWRQFMLKNLRSQVRFVSDHKAASDLEQAIRDCPFSKLKGGPTGLVLLHFDVKKFGESATRPDLRLPPLRDGPYTRLVRAVMTPGRAKAQQRLCSQAKSQCCWTASRRDEDDGDGDDDDCEEEEDTRPNLVSDLLQIGYTEALSLPARERKHYGPGSSTGDLISGVDLPKLSTEWCLPWQQKKTLYGKKHLIAVGGKTETTEETEKSDMDRLGNKPEPVCFHSMPGAFYSELMHSFWAKMVIDLTPGDGRFTFEALKARVGYMGITFTPEHSQFLEEHLLDLMKLEMCDTASPLFNSEYAAAVGKKVPKAKANPVRGCFGFAGCFGQVRGCFGFAGCFGQDHCDAHLYRDPNSVVIIDAKFLFDTLLSNTSGECERSNLEAEVIRESLSICKGGLSILDVPLLFLLHLLPSVNARELTQATIITSIIACCSACWRVTKEYAIYPVKQSIVDTFDSIQESLFPYKQGVKAHGSEHKLGACSLELVWQVPYSYTEADASFLSLFTCSRVTGGMDDWLTDRAQTVSRPSVNTRNEQSSESDVSDVKVLAPTGPKLLQRPKPEEGLERSDEKATTPAKTLKQKEEEYAAARARIFGDTAERGGRGRGRGRGGTGPQPSAQKIERFPPSEQKRQAHDSRHPTTPCSHRKWTSVCHASLFAVGCKDRSRLRVTDADDPAGT
ncbi:unnamed protein product [Symbiodinium sp. CCMP2592]|nr:unnamed protein product [Symbiodinium sp. CCMP2592]